MVELISVIIPNRNGGATIWKCLDAVFSSRCDRYEVIVVDDCSEDGSVEIIRQFPCRLIRLDQRSGAGKARNAGAACARGDILFFTDADCIVGEDTLAIVRALAVTRGPNVVLGGTYAREPYDAGFFSRFQSVFVNYSETKRLDGPDYVASHAMAVHAETFGKSGGFAEDFFPILEDVELSHRLRNKGGRLAVDPRILVRHVFNFSLGRSFRNAFRKSRYWTMYSLANGDLFADSGTASAELKVNVLSYVLCLALFAAWAVSGSLFALSCALLTGVLNLMINRKLLRAFFEARGTAFAFAAFAYYALAYPLPVGAGALLGAASCLIAGKLRAGSCGAEARAGGES